MKLMATATDRDGRFVTIHLASGSELEARRAKDLFRQVWLEDESGSITRVLKDNLGTLRGQFRRPAEDRR